MKWLTQMDGYMKEVIELLERALALLKAREDPAPAPSPSTLRWGRKVSQVFKDRVIWIGQELGVDPNYLMDCMAWESAETFSPDIRNMAGSGATGLIQFMPSTARGMGTTVERLAAMTAEDQLRYVYRYFKPYKGRLRDLGDVYMAILWPKGVGKPLAWKLWDKASMPTTYRQNSGLDINKDSVITKAEAVAKVLEKSKKGELFRG